MKNCATREFILLMSSKPPIPVMTPRKRPMVQVPKANRRSVDLASTRVCEISVSQPFKLSRRLSNVDKSSSDMSSLKMLSQLRSASHNPHTLPLPELEFVIQISFISNWGSPNLISISEIDFLTKDRVPIQNVKVVTKNAEEDLIKLQKMVDRELIKTNIDAAWSHEWSPNHEPLCYTFILRSPSSPEFIRIWGGKFDTKSQVRDFSIYTDGTFQFKGEVPYEFGGVFPVHPKLPSLQPHITAVELNLRAPIPLEETDQYGPIPIPKTKSIVVKIFCPFDPTSPFVGLNCIEFFEPNGKNVNFSMIRSVKVDNGTGITSALKLLKDKRRTMESAEMWTVKREYPDKPITLSIAFVKEVKIIMMRFWNYNGDESETFGAKKISIYLDDKPYWIGCLNMAKGMTTNIQNSVTDVWLTDPNRWKDSPHITEIPTSRSDSSQ